MHFGTHDLTLGISRERETDLPGFSDRAPQTLKKVGQSFKDFLCPLVLLAEISVGNPPSDEPSDYQPGGSQEDGETTVSVEMIIRRKCWRRKRAEGSPSRRWRPPIPRWIGC